MRHFLAQSWRLIQINWIFARHGLDRVLLSLHIFSPLFFLSYLNPSHWFRKEEFNRAVAIRRALEDLGPIFIKFGQALSTRCDLIPADILRELEVLQDKVPSFPSDIAREIVERELEQPIHKLFAKFEDKPLASASIAQVYTARLHDGREVVVKVLRPQVRQQIERDVKLLYTLARIVERYWAHGKRVRPVDMVAEFDKTLQGELDFLREASNASQLRNNFENSPMLYVPEIYWPYACKQVLVMERIYGIPISDKAQLKEYGINMKKLAERGVELFFTQVFRDCFFHADMHPGNIFVSTSNPKNPQLMVVDFGILGSLSESDKYYLARNFLAFFQRDYRLVAELHIESGWLPKETRAEEFEAAMRAVCEPIFARPLEEISFAQLILRLIQTSREFQMNIQPQLILLQKTLFAVEGLGRQLYPQLDLWQTAKPFLERWISKQVSPKAFIDQFHKRWPAMLNELPRIPGLMHDVLQLTKDAHLQQLQQQKFLAEQSRPKMANCIIAGLGFALALTGTSLYFFDNFEETIRQFVSSITLVKGLLLLAAFCLGYAWWAQKK